MDDVQIESTKSPSLAESETTDNSITLKSSNVKSVSYKSILLTAANISNNIVGAGIITLPKALKDSGIGVGILFLAISTIMCGWTFTMMAVCGELCQTTTYEKTVRKLLGKPGYYLVIICTILFPISSAIAYGITIAANLQSFFMGIFPEYFFYKNRALLMIIPYYFIIFPLTLVKDMKFLERFSTFSMILVLFYVCTIFWKLNSIPYEIQTLPGTFVFGKLTAFKALPVFAFACSCHHNVISFYKSLKDRSINNFVISKNIAFNFSFVLYIAVAISGFITFGGQPLDNIFENYCSNDILMNITRLIFTVTLLLTSPLQLFAPRQVITQNVLVKFCHSKWIHAVITFILISVCYVTVVLIDNIGMVIEIGGAITNVPIVYIFPSMCSLMIYGKPYLEFNIKKILSWIILLLGIIMLFGCPYLTIKSLVTKSDFMPIEKYYCEKN